MDWRLLIASRCEWSLSVHVRVCPAIDWGPVEEVVLPIPYVTLDRLLMESSDHVSTSPAIVQVHRWWWP